MMLKELWQKQLFGWCGVGEGVREGLGRRMGMRGQAGVIRDREGVTLSDVVV